MKKASTGKLLLVLLVGCFFCIGSLWCQLNQRFFDDAPRQSDNVRLTVLFPSLGDIRALENLRNQGLLSVKNLIVIGLYHKKQLTNFEDSIRFATENGCDWLKFHELKENLHPEKLFQKNALGEELLKIFSYSDGLLLFGGADIPPTIYLEKTSLLTDISTPYRCFLDVMVVFHLLGGWQDEGFKPYLESRKEFPVLGLCLGCQSLNVGAGGTLYQDISSEIYGKHHIEDIIAMTRESWHDNPYVELYPREFRSSNMHRIKLQAEGKFVKDWGLKVEDKPQVYSSHHQAVRKLGKGIRVIATSLDGKVIEAIDHTAYPNVLGVQFHPEARSLWDANKKSRLTPEDKEEANLLSILENNPPSLAFHKKIWSWFTEKLKASHKHR
ncbi:MAG: gamma-glutamyl-gamma-aminobutyrate hydrolase family protein [Candidatus Aminicenantes bacterium]|nr:MAG: gamma-glutamyl-gamma-aminobutyrate hydrolase family protein [Candidatus Aminicenantes bacterium]